MVEFDEAFYPYLNDLLAGREIPPLVSDDAYGWLLTIYQPVFNSSGDCACYIGVDVSMDRLRAEGYVFLSKAVSLFLSFSMLILALAVIFAQHSIILPVNRMAVAASAFAYTSEEARTEGMNRIRTLGIHTRDEIENLYHAFEKTTGDSVHYLSELQEKTHTIESMQEGLIMVLADMVESRDENTGQHIRKTAAYVRIIVEQMKKEGIYADQLTDEFISDCIKSAPLHDVGKIQIPDAILNKPGKLTDEEYEIMKTHSRAGEEIITKVMETVPEPGYLEEARRLAAHHHERWDGRGYPGEETPLSARIMAVADVFDALVSTRAYKKGFSFEKSIGIIQEGIGTQFDPKVAEAFLHAEDEVRRVSQEFQDRK